MSRFLVTGIAQSVLTLWLQDSRHPRKAAKIVGKSKGSDPGQTSFSARSPTGHVGDSNFRIFTDLKLYLRRNARQVKQGIFIFLSTSRQVANS
jgi:hypothetical protein